MQALAVLPLTLAVLLALSAPLACFATTDDCSRGASAAPTVSMLSQAHEAAAPSIQSGDLHQDSDRSMCHHAAPNVQAPGSDQSHFSKAAYVAADALIVVPVPAPLTFALRDRPGMPPAILLTAAQLRI